MRITPYSLSNAGRLTAPAGAADLDNVLDHTKRGRPCRVGDAVYRSTWEAVYAQHLEAKRQRGEIACWEYEPDLFIFDGVAFEPRTYSPDFKVTDNAGNVSYDEVKGWMDQLSKLKLKRMGKFFPEVTVKVIDAAVIERLLQDARP